MKGVYLSSVRRQDLEKLSLTRPTSLISSRRLQDSKNDPSEGKADTFQLFYGLPNPPEARTVGCAWIGTPCNSKYNVGVMEMSVAGAYLGNLLLKRNLLAHEHSHNLGATHHSKIMNGIVYNAEHFSAQSVTQIHTCLNGGCRNDCIEFKKGTLTTAASQPTKPRPAMTTTTSTTSITPTTNSPTTTTTTTTTTVELAKLTELNMKRQVKITGNKGESVHFIVKMPDKKLNRVKVHLKDKSNDTELYVSWDHKNVLGAANAMQNDCVKTIGKKKKVCWPGQLKPYGKFLFVSVYGKDNFKNVRIKVTAT